MNKIFLIHFSPLEMYPPVQNFIHVLEQDRTSTTVYVVTTAVLAQSDLKPFSSANKKVRLIRLGKLVTGRNFFTRMWNYSFFFVGCFFYLLIKRPKRILYYETISSFPAWFYRRFFSRRVEVFIHYHEYTSPAEYKNGMALTRIFHNMEKWLYPRAAWVSHTNENRMRLFETDILPVTILKRHVIPNYPPKSWYTDAPVSTHDPLRLVYVGALSLDTMFTRELAQWVKDKNGEVTWDIYSNNNLANEVRSFLEELQVPGIRIRGGLNYDELAVVLKEYDVGLILYKGHITNFVYNAPNKLFEYLACGLDVWYPPVMREIDSYKTTDSFPKVVEVDFEKMSTFNLQHVLNKKGLKKGTSPFFCEDALAMLAAYLCN